MKRKEWLLVLALCLLAGGYALVMGIRTAVPTADYDVKTAAAELTAQCFASIRQRKEELGILPSPANDVNDTGMIGQDFSYITTTLGELEAKRTTTNPNMAAVVVDMFNELGLQPGDEIAVNCSGSFPAMNIAVLCAAEVMGLEPTIIASFGSSTYGANDQNFTYLDMEHYLWQEGLLSHKSSGFSIGGEQDKGTEMPDEVKEEVISRLEGLGYTFLYDEDIVRSINERYDLYREGREIVCFVNVGGNEQSFGDSPVLTHTGGGIITELPEHDNSTGLVQLFLRDQIPVVHILNIKTLSSDYGMPIDPVPLPKIGEGGVYYSYDYHQVLIWVSLLAALVPVGAYVRCIRREKREKTAEKEK